MTATHPLVPTAPVVHSPATAFTRTDEVVATEPIEHRGRARDEVRLLVATDRAITHTRFTVLADHLEPGDLVVVNTSSTRPAELDGRIDRDPVVVHLANRLDDGSWVVELRTAPDAANPILDAEPGTVITLPAAARLRLLAPYPGSDDTGPTSPGPGHRLWRAEASARPPLAGVMRRFGRPIAYGYLSARWPLADYQTIFARDDGSAEMPSAGRPFSGRVLADLAARGVRVAPITLHTGVSSQDAGEGPQAERYSVPPTTAELVNATRESGRRVVAVGTTVTRALESATGPDGRTRPEQGWTTLVIGPDRPVRVISGLVTGWHDPQASHLMLVEAVAGAALTQRAYDAAIAEHYRWHEFGDSALLLP